MGFYAYNFTFDGKSSEDYGLFICSIGSKSSSPEDGGGAVNIHTDKTNKMDHNYLLGTSYDNVLSFTLTFGCKQGKTRLEVSEINNWLIGHDDYKKLYIEQEDMVNIYFNCILNDFKIVSIAGIPYAFECEVVCDRGWGLENEKDYIYNVSSTGNSFSHNNTSHTNKITLPVLTIKMSGGGDITITNVTNDNYQTKLTGLNSGEIITLDCENEIILSSLGLMRLSNFNKHWFELLPGNNNITITGNISEIKITYSNIRKVGA